MCIRDSPELSWHETRTTELLGNRLVDAGLRVRPLSRTGLLADLGPADAAYRIALRADLDALPVVERTGAPWASRTDGVTHACGHDVHTVACLGAGLGPVSYTHLDVYKRQGLTCCRHEFREATIGQRPCSWRESARESALGRVVARLQATSWALSHLPSTTQTRSRWWEGVARARGPGLRQWRRG